MANNDWIYWGIGAAGVLGLNYLAQRRQTPNNRQAAQAAVRSTMNGLAQSIMPHVRHPALRLLAEQAAATPLQAEQLPPQPRPCAKPQGFAQEPRIIDAEFTVEEDPHA